MTQLLLFLTASSLGHLVRPDMGVSPVLAQGQVARVRQVPTPPVPLAQLGAAPKQLPAALSLRTSAAAPGEWQQAGVITPSQVSLLTLAPLLQSARR